MPRTVELDVFGIEMKCKTNEEGAKPFYMGFDDWEVRIDKNSDNYSRWNNGNFDGEGTDLTIRDTSGKDARYTIYAVSRENYANTKIPILCRKKLTEKTYMQTSKDWRNIEMTGWVYVEKANSNDEITFYARSGKHGNNARKDTGIVDWKNGCEGCALKACIHYDGTLKYDKETHHGSDNQGDMDAPAELQDGIKGKWIGFKYILYNKNGRNEPTMEWWIDFLNSNEYNVNSSGVPRNEWKKVHTMVDDGFGDGNECDDCPTKGVPITWGGPIAMIRWDKIENVHLKWVSVREINPPNE